MSRKEGSWRGILSGGVGKAMGSGQNLCPGSGGHLASGLTLKGLASPSTNELELSRTPRKMCQGRAQGFHGGDCTSLIDGQVDTHEEQKVHPGCRPGCGPGAGHRWEGPSPRSHLTTTLTETVELGVLVP